MWAGLVQLEKLDNEAKVEGFGPWEHLSFAVILSLSAGLIPFSCSQVWALKAVGAEREQGRIIAPDAHLWPRAAHVRNRNATDNCYSHKALPPNLIPSGGFQHVNVGGGKHSVFHTAYCAVHPGACLEFELEFDS